MDTRPAPYLNNYIIKQYKKRLIKNIDSINIAIPENEYQIREAQNITSPRMWRYELKI